MNGNKSLDEILQVFSFGQLQDFLTILKHLELHNISVLDIKKYIEFRKQNSIKSIEKYNEQLIEDKKIWNMIAKNCPHCNHQMDLFSVNTNKRNRIDGDYKSQWFCNNCGFDELSIYTTHEITLELYNKYKLKKE